MLLLYAWKRNLKEQKIEWKYNKNSNNLARIFFFYLTTGMTLCHAFCILLQFCDICSKDASFLGVSYTMPRDKANKNGKQTKNECRLKPLHIGICKQQHCIVILINFKSHNWIWHFNFQHLIYLTDSSGINL